MKKIMICGILLLLLIPNIVFAGEASYPSDCVRVTSDIGSCYATFSIQGIRGAFAFASHAKWSTITFPKGTILIDDSVEEDSIFSFNATNCSIRGAGRDYTMFIVLCNKTLFDLKGDGFYFSDINITFITENNKSDRLAIRLDGSKSQHNFNVISNLWITLIDYKTYIKHSFEG